MVSTNFASTSNAARAEISELRKKMAENNKDNSLTAEQRTEKNKEINAQIDALNDKISSGGVNMSAANVGSTNFLFGNNRDQNQTGFDFFFGAGASLDSLRTVNSARLGIEGRARNLMAEIRMDQMRGRDTSFKQEQLSNLTGNLDIMNKNLASGVDRALAEPKAKQANAPSHIDRINAQLKAMQQKEEKAVQEKWGSREAPEPEEIETPETPPAETPETPPAETPETPAGD